MTSTILIISGALLLILIFLAALSRHKKSGSKDLKVMGATGVVESALAPEGSVIVKGELWRATSEVGSLPSQTKIRVVGHRAHLLLVESVSGEI